MANRRIEKQIANFHHRADRATTRRGRFDDATTHVDFGTAVIRFGTAANRQMRNTANRRQSFAAKAKCADTKESFVVGQFTGRVRRQSKRQLFGRHATTIVGDPNQLRPSALD